MQFRNIIRVGASIAVLLIASTAQAQVRRYIAFENQCSKSIRLYVSHADGYRNWHVHGPFLFNGHEGLTKLKDNGVVLTQSDNHDLYVYAESVDGTRIWSGDYQFEYSGMVFNMMKANANLVGGELQFPLTC